MIPACLWILATLDAAFAGYRAAAGRNALIDKRSYYRAAMLRGALYGQAVIGLVGAWIGLLHGFVTEPAMLTHAFYQAGQQMLLVYLPFALLVLATLLIRWIPSVDLRSLTSVLIFGPCTLFRPLVILLGVSLGVHAARSIPVTIVGVVVVLLMVPFESIFAKLGIYHRAGLRQLLLEAAQSTDKPNA